MYWLWPNCKFQGQNKQIIPIKEQIVNIFKLCNLQLASVTDSLIFLLCLSLYFFIYFIWRLITLQYCSGFCHTLIWISHGFTCAPNPEPPSHLPPPPIPLDNPSAPALSTCLMYRTWTGDLFHIWYYTCFNVILSDHPILAFSHRVQKTVVYICVSSSVSHIGLLLPSF